MDTDSADNPGFADGNGLIVHLKTGKPSDSACSTKGPLQFTTAGRARGTDGDIATISMEVEGTGLSAMAKGLDDTTGTRRTTADNRDRQIGRAGVLIRGPDSKVHLGELSSGASGPSNKGRSSTVEEARDSLPKQERLWTNDVMYELHYCIGMHDNSLWNVMVTLRNDVGTRSDLQRRL